MNDNEIKKLKEYVKKRFDDAGLDYQSFDTVGEMDTSINFSEARAEIDDKLDKLIPDEDDLKNYKNKELRYRAEELSFRDKFLKDHNPLQRKYLDHFRTIAIYGDIGQGKTALAYKILEQYKDRPIFFVKHPKPEIIKRLGYANLRNLEELERLSSCIVCIDEPQLFTSIYDHKTNEIIARVCSLARQRDIKLIIGSSDTRVFSRHNEAYFELWLIKDVEFSMVKNGSKIKKAIKDNAILDPNGFRLEIDEYVVENRKFVEINGKHKFKLPKEWTEEQSTPYRK